MPTNGSRGKTKNSDWEGVRLENPQGIYKFQLYLTRIIHTTSFKIEFCMGRLINSETSMLFLESYEM